MSKRYSEEFLEKNWKEWFLAIQGFFYFTQGVAMVAILLLPIYMQEIFFEPLYYQEKAIELSLYYAGIIMIPWSAKLIFDYYQTMWVLVSLEEENHTFFLQGYLE